MLAGIELDEQKCPATNTTFWLATLFAADTACFGSQASSSTISLSCLPSTPPALLMSSTAISAPAFICAPKVALLPVIGPTVAMLICAWAAPAVERDASDGAPAIKCPAKHRDFPLS